MKINSLKKADETKAHMILYGPQETALQLGIKLPAVYKRLNRAGLTVKISSCSTVSHLVDIHT